MSSLRAEARSRIWRSNLGADVGWGDRSADRGWRGLSNKRHFLRLSTSSAEAARSVSVELGVRRRTAIDSVRRLLAVYEQRWLRTICSAVVWPLLSSGGRGTSVDYIGRISSRQWVRLGEVGGTNEDLISTSTAVHHAGEGADDTQHIH